jgi:hypothetical protein
MTAKNPRQAKIDNGWNTTDEIKHIDKLGHTGQGEVIDYIKGYLKALNNRVNVGNQALIKNGVLV